MGIETIFHFNPKYLYVNELIKFGSDALPYWGRNVM